MNNNDYLAILNKIKSKFEKQGYVQGKRNKFGLLECTKDYLFVSRKKGENTKIENKHLINAIKGIINDISYYDKGVREYKRFNTCKRIESPIWALIHSLDKEDYKVK